ncbi:related to toxD gene [Cephalotrichum gorgonifer]|uniref:Related to toxD protein n=1 Tax=Cephalotrichum gorgonifer TaxID=2041049 RepID=A0AAE8N3J2_9PEZI|nr:related to toxD gene [Cephalotrichum gorgonifer]
MKGLVLTPSTGTASVLDVPLPVPGSGEVLVRVHAVAINPVDQFYYNEPIATQEQRVLGVDFAGEVVGRNADLNGFSDRRVKDGTRVAGFVQGANSANDRPGAFAEYVVTPYDLLWELPGDLSFEEASTISMCGLTAAQGLFPRFGLPSPFSQGSITPVDDPINVLIYGSSTSLGLFGAQLAHLAAQASGRKFRLIGTASTSKHELLRSAPYNYDVLVDYRDADWPEKVKAATAGTGIHFALDTISERDTVEKVHSTLNPQGKYHLFRGQGGGQFDSSKLEIQPFYGTVWEGLGHEVDYGDGLVFPAPPEAREFAVKFFEFLGSGAEEGKAKLHPNPVRKMPGGLDRIVPDAFSLLSGLVSDRKDIGRTEEHMRPISGEKLVYSIV